MEKYTVKEHFNLLAENYWNEIPDHIREHLFEKLWKFVKVYYGNTEL